MWKDIVKNDVALGIIKEDLPKYIRWLEHIAKEHRGNRPLNADLINQRCYTIQKGLENILKMLE